MPLTLLITGFEPFGGSSINPSAEILRRLKPTSVTGATLARHLLPVESGAAVETLLRVFRRSKPDAVVCLGESGVATGMVFERLAANLRDYRIADNKGTTIIDQPVVDDGPAAYFATLPLRAMLAAAHKAGVPADLSMSAGTYLCNEVMYAILHETVTRGPMVPAGFVHLPQLPAQAIAVPRGRATMAVETSLRGVLAALAALVASTGPTKPRRPRSK